MRFIGVEVERSPGGWSLACLAWSFSSRTWSFPTTRLRVQPNYDSLRARINAAVGKVEPHSLSFLLPPPFDRRTRSATLFDAFSSSSLSLPSLVCPYILSRSGTYFPSDSEDVHIPHIHHHVLHSCCCFRCARRDLRVRCPLPEGRCPRLGEFFSLVALPTRCS